MYREYRDFGLGFKTRVEREFAEVDRRASIYEQEFMKESMPQPILLPSESGFLRSKMDEEFSKFFPLSK